MKNGFSTLLVLVAGFCAVIGLIGCTPRIHITINETGNTNGTVSVVSGETIEQLGKRLSEISEEELNNEKSSIFDKDEVTKSLENQGIAVKKIELTSFMGINIDLFANKNQKLFSQLIKNDSKNKIVTIGLDKNIIQQGIGVLPEGSEDYIDLLLAPIFTGEKMTPSEYENNLSIVYGKKIASELSNSVFKMKITVPGKITNAQITPFGEMNLLKGRESNTVEANINLSQLLTLQEKLDLQITYE